jgi:hypothetical protein
MIGYPKLIILFPGILMVARTKEEEKKHIKYNMLSILAAFPICAIGFLALWMLI